MDKIIWNDSLSVGDAIIDSQHRTILELINRLIDNRKETVASPLISDVLQAITTYATEHFRYEENFLEKLDYPEIAKQREEHKQFKLKVAELYDATYLEVAEIPEVLLIFLKEWWLNHILVEDMAYSKFISK